MEGVPRLIINKQHIQHALLLLALLLALVVVGAAAAHRRCCTTTALMLKNYICSDTKYNKLVII
jgi:hypothetical protein